MIIFTFIALFIVIYMVGALVGVIGEIITDYGSTSIGWFFSVFIASMFATALLYM